MAEKENQKKSHTGLKVAAAALTTAAATAAYFKLTYEVFKKACVRGATHFDTSEDTNVLARVNTTWLESIPHQDRFIMSHDGLSLHGVTIPASTDTHQWILLIHGYDADCDQLLGLAKTYHALGYHVLTIDLRGFGLSEGDYITFGAKESDDINAWIEEVCELDPGCNVILHGLSLGAASALIASSKCDNAALKGVIADSSYSSYKDQMKFLCSKLFHVPGSSVLPGLSFWIKNKAGFDYESTDVAKAISIHGVPTLFFHGQNDHFIPLEHVYRLSNALNAAGIVEIVPYKCHGQCMLDGSYMKKCLLFVQKQFIESV